MKLLKSITLLSSMLMLFLSNSVLAGPAPPSKPTFKIEGNDVVVSWTHTSFSSNGGDYYYQVFLSSPYQCSPRIKVSNPKTYRFKNLPANKDLCFSVVLIQRLYEPCDKENDDSRRRRGVGGQSGIQCGYYYKTRAAGRTSCTKINSCPDLALTSIIVSPSKPKPGDRVKIISTVKNVGSVRIERTIWIETNISTKKAPSGCGGLLPGSTYSETCYYTIPLNATELTIVSTAKSKLDDAECSLSNNKLTKVFKFSCPSLNVSIQKRNDYCDAARKGPRHTDYTSTVSGGCPSTSIQYKWSIKNNINGSISYFYTNDILGKISPYYNYTITLSITQAGVSKSVSQNYYGCLGKYIERQGEKGEFDNDFESQVYPNPFTDNLQINFNNSGHKSASITLTDMTGKMILNQDLSGQKGFQQRSISTSHLPKGIYLYELKANNRIHRGKITKF